MKYKKLALVFGAVMSIAAAVMYFNFTVSEPIVETIVRENRSAAQVGPIGDGDPGDNSGLYYFMAYPHNEDITGTYDVNLSNATAYEYCDYGNMSCTKETPYSTAYDLIWKVGVTNEDGYWTGNQSRNPDYNWLIASCTTPLGFTDLNITGGNEVFIANTTEMAWYHYVLQDADGGNGTGFTFVEGQNANVTGKFYVCRIVP